MSVPQRSGPVRVPTGRPAPGSRPPGVRPPGVGSGPVPVAPARARRLDRRRRPTLRPLAEVVAAGGGTGSSGTVTSGTVPSGTVTSGWTPGVPPAAWEVALDTACTQVAPLAAGVLAAVGDALDGRRSLGALAATWPDELRTRIEATIRLARRRSPRFPPGGRVRGLRTCAVITRDGGVAVEVAAALCVAGPRHPGRARAVAARFELDARTRTWTLRDLVVG